MTPHSRPISHSTSLNTFRFVASPRHADLLPVTGPVSRHMETALKRTYAAMPELKRVVAVGDCGCDGGIFGS